jgi:predicted RNase H-like HicB family nuclease
MDYPIIIVPLSDADGGGYMGYAPDLVGCMSDGESYEEAARNTIDAIGEWIDAAQQRGIDVPRPGTAAMRDRMEKERLVKALKAVTEDVGEIDGRLRELERTVKEIEEKIDNADAWARCASLTGIPANHFPEELLPLNHN